MNAFGKHQKYVGVSNFMLNLPRVSKDASETASPGAGAADTVVEYATTYAPILNNTGFGIGKFGDSSLSLGTGVFTTEVSYKIDSDLSTGEYWVDYINGRIRGAKATTGTSEALTYIKWTIDTELDVDIELGSVKITDGTNDVGVIATILSLKTDLSSVAGTVTAVDAGNSSAGVQRVTLSTDDINTAAMNASLSIMDDWDATEDAAIGADGAVVIFKARDSQQTAMSANDDAVIPVTTLYGEQVIAGYNWSTQKVGTSESDPLDEHYINESLVDTTNVSAATHYYPSSTGGTMDGFKDQSLSGKLIDADGTLTLTLEVSNDEDSTNADWNDAYFYDDELNATVATKTVTNGTELFTLSCNNNNFRRYRWVVVASGATNTVILKERKKAL